MPQPSPPSFFPSGPSLHPPGRLLLASQALSEREAEEAAVQLRGAGDGLGNYQQRQRETWELSHANSMQKAMQSYWTPGQGWSTQLTEGPVGKSSHPPDLGGVTHPGKQKPCVSCPASRDFSDVPGRVQWCLYSFVYLLTTYYASGNHNSAVNEAGKLLGGGQRH